MIAIKHCSSCLLKDASPFMGGPCPGVVTRDNIEQQKPSITHGVAVPNDNPEQISELEDKVTAILGMVTADLDEADILIVMYFVGAQRHAAVRDFAGKIKEAGYNGCTKHEVIDQLLEEMK